MGCTNKSAYISQNNVDILIDDLKQNCLEAEAVGTKSIMFDGITKLQNVKNQEPKSSKFARTWKHVFENIQELLEESINAELSTDENV